jgi:hypothetical protein
MRVDLVCAYAIAKASQINNSNVLLKRVLLTEQKVNFFKEIFESGIYPPPYVAAPLSRGGYFQA